MNVSVKSVQILGSTGSIGTSTLSVIREHPTFFKVKTLVAHSNWQLLSQQAIEFEAENVCIMDKRFYSNIEEALSGYDIQVYDDLNKIDQVLTDKYDITISAISGVAGLVPTWNAITNSKSIGIANKESIICAGSLLINWAKHNNTILIPVDSEHSAIHQTFDVNQYDNIESVVITASGGPFRNISLKEMENITPQQAVKHPNWRMGQKISVDSATLMNKGLEAIEASILFNINIDKIKVIIHPQSIIHGMVNYKDGSTIAQLSMPNMRTPIAYALHYPFHHPLKHEPLDLSLLGQLDFTAPDYERFPLLKLAIDVGNSSMDKIIALNCANEVAVNAFLNQKIRFLDIYKVVLVAIDEILTADVITLQDVLDHSKRASLLTKHIIDSI